MATDIDKPTPGFHTEIQAYAAAYVSLRDAYIELALLHAQRLEQPDYWRPMCQQIASTLRDRLIRAGIDYETATLLAYPPPSDG